MYKLQITLWLHDLNQHSNSTQLNNEKRIHKHINRKQICFKLSQEKQITSINKTKKKSC